MNGASLSIPPGIVSFLTAAGPLLALGSLLFSLILFAIVFVHHRRIKNISSGAHGSLEETLSRLSRDVKELQQFRGELQQYLKHAEGRIHSSLRGVGVVRFNAFQNGAGGNQSFAIALLDEKHSGVVFSALYSRDRVGVYAKPLEKGVSPFTLSSEEEEAVAKAQAQLGAHPRREQ
ncbi:MAG: hypothetical protein QG621_248 [Patescibacteria group bacterium]|nr:hypothetical protein [Patescibacteria group bacterium]